MPRPPAEFSPFTIARSGAWRSRSPGIASRRPLRPGLPTTSPTKRSFTRARLREGLDLRVRVAGARAALFDLGLPAVVARLADERLRRAEREVGQLLELDVLRHAPSDNPADVGHKDPAGGGRHTALGEVRVDRLAGLDPGHVQNQVHRVGVAVADVDLNFDVWLARGRLDHEPLPRV